LSKQNGLVGRDSAPYPRPPCDSHSRKSPPFDPSGEHLDFRSDPNGCVTALNSCRRCSDDGAVLAADAQGRRLDAQPAAEQARRATRLLQVREEVLVVARVRQLLLQGPQLQVGMRRSEVLHFLRRPRATLYTRTVRLRGPTTMRPLPGSTSTAWTATRASSSRRRR
jgi:hypothetical protein